MSASTMREVLIMEVVLVVVLMSAEQSRVQFAL